MTISGITSNSGLYQAASSNLAQLKQDIQSLGKALQSCDLSSAQKEDRNEKNSICFEFLFCFGRHM
jgi:hypothetical protein